MPVLGPPCLSKSPHYGYRRLAWVVVTWTLGMGSMAASLTPVRNYRGRGWVNKTTLMACTTFGFLPTQKPFWSLCTLWGWWTWWLASGKSHYNLCLTQVIINPLRAVATHEDRGVGPVLGLDLWIWVVDSGHQPVGSFCVPGMGSFYVWTLDAWWVNFLYLIPGGWRWVTPGGWRASSRGRHPAPALVHSTTLQIFLFTPSVLPTALFLSFIFNPFEIALVVMMFHYISSTHFFEILNIYVNILTPFNRYFRNRKSFMQEGSFRGMCIGHCDSIVCWKVINVPVAAIVCT